jgi:hypothetical protein
MAVNAMVMALLALVVVPGALLAQQVPIVTLKPANALIADSQFAVHPVRELSDGRVLVDGRNGKLLVADFLNGAVEKVDSIPAGPLIALPGDTTLITVYGTGWLFLDGTRLLGMLPKSNAVVTLATPNYGLSRDGKVLAVSGGQPRTDSASVFLVDRGTGAKQLITNVWQGKPAMANVPAPIYSVNEEPLLMADGWIAVVRAHPYRVDWRSPDGQWALGAALPVAPVTFDMRERLAYLARQGAPPSDSSMDLGWPALVEPFTHAALLPTPDGDIVVQRTSTADLPGALYDVINRHGDLEREVTFPMGAREQVVGFGANAIYTMAVLKGRAPEQLERHPWP